MATVRGHVNHIPQPPTSTQTYTFTRVGWQVTLCDDL